MAPVVASFTTGYNGGSGQLTLTKPTGVTSGDVLVVWAYDQINRPFNAITGWTQYESTVGTDSAFSAYVRVADGTEGATLTVAQSSPFRVLGGYLRITGADITGLAFQPDGSNGNENTIDWPATTSPATDSLDLLLLGVKQDTTGQPNPTGYALEAELQSAGNTVQAFSDVVPSGSIAAQSFSIGSFRTWSSGRLTIAPASGGGTDVTVTPGTGSATVTGAAPTVSADASVTSGLGTASVEGFAPTVTTSTVVNVSVTPGTGTATVSGFAPSISAGGAEAPGTGAATVGGFAPSVSADVAATPGAATATVEGFAPTFTTLEVVDVTVSPGTGATSVSGSAPSIATDAAVTPGTGTAIVRGFAPVVNNDGSGQPAKMRRCLGIGLGL